MRSPISKPLLAATLADPESLAFPCYATPKVDGVRALVLDGDLVSRQLKTIRNTINRILRQLLPEGADGEITVGTTFSETSSAVMRGEGSADFDREFTFHWFDFVADSLDKPYLHRVRDMQRHIAEHPACLRHAQARVVPLLPATIADARALSDFEKTALEGGFEGVMVRAGGGRYKSGRPSEKASS